MGRGAERVASVRPAQAAGGSSVSLPSPTEGAVRRCDPGAAPTSAHRARSGVSFEPCLNFLRHGSPCERGGGNSFRSRRYPSLCLIMSFGERPGARDPRCLSAGVRPGPQPGRLAWSRGMPAEAGLSLPANLPSPSPVDTHPQGGGQCLCGEAPAVTGDAQCLHLLGSTPRLGCFSSLQAPVYPLLGGHQSPLQSRFLCAQAFQLYATSPHTPYEQHTSVSSQLLVFHLEFYSSATTELLRTHAALFDPPSQVFPLPTIHSGNSPPSTTLQTPTLPSKPWSTSPSLESSPHGSRQS